jgi:DNA-binding NarL/FixJ family response regulator
MPRSKGCAVVVAHSQPVIRAGLCSILDQDESISVVQAIGVKDDLFEFIHRHESAVKVLEIGAALRLCDHYGRCLAVLTEQEFHLASRLLGGGSDALLLLDDCYFELAAAVRAVDAGGLYLSSGMKHVALRFGVPATLPTGLAPEGLTARQRDVLQLICQGMTNAQIASSLGISEKTVKFHVSSLLSKAQVRNRASLIAAARNPSGQDEERTPQPNQEWRYRYLSSDGRRREGYPLQSNPSRHSVQIHHEQL